MQEFLDEYSGPNLRTKRDNLLLSQIELAEKIGVSRITVLSWENAKMKPSRKHLRALKKFFDTHKEVE